MYDDTNYLSEVRPVAKEKKRLKLMEQSSNWVAWGFEVSLEEITKFFSQTCADEEFLDDVIQTRRFWKPQNEYAIISGIKHI